MPETPPTVQEVHLKPIDTKTQSPLGQDPANAEERQDILELLRPRLEGQVGPAPYVPDRVRLAESPEEA